MISGLTPLVSVIIPTKNRHKLLDQTLNSVRAQTYQRWEAVVVDDGSTDETLNTIRRHCEQDGRIKLLRRPNDHPAGGSACRNLGLSNSTSDYVIFLDSDDLLAPQCLSARVDYIEQHPELDFAAFQAQAFCDVIGDLNVALNVPRDVPDLDRFLHLDHPWSITGPIWRRAALDRLGGFDPSLPSWQDWELNIRALCRGVVYQTVNASDYFFRRKASNDRTSSLQRKDLRHLNGAIPLFVKIRNELQNSRNLNVDRDRAIVGLAFLVVMRINWEYGLSLALKTWTRALEVGVVPLTDYFFGSVVLASLKPPLIKRVAWNTVLKLFRRKIHWHSKRVML